jgi:hypothetical protein
MATRARRGSPSTVVGSALTNSTVRSGALPRNSSQWSVHLGQVDTFSQHCPAGQARKVQHYAALSRNAHLIRFVKALKKQR